MIRMASLCSRSEQCAADIREKLRKLELPSHTVNEIIEQLIAQRFIDDARFARAFANDKIRFSGWGRLKIRAALVEKKVDRDIIEAAIDNIDFQEYIDVMRRVGSAKAKSLNLALRDDQARLYRFLLSRGFESKLSMQLIEALRRE